MTIFTRKYHLFPQTFCRLTAVMNHLLGQTPDGFDSEAANVNGDEEGVTITDLVLIIDMILRNNASDDGGE